MSASTNVTACTTAVYEWLFHNGLALNPDNSESALFGAVARIKSLSHVVLVSVAGTQMSLSHCTKSLGLIFDENLKFNHHSMLTLVRSVRVISSMYEPSAIFVHWCPPKQRWWSIRHAETVKNYIGHWCQSFLPHCNQNIELCHTLLGWLTRDFQIPFKDTFLRTFVLLVVPRFQTHE